MKIKFETSGGFGGLSRHWEVDGSELDADHRQIIKDLLDQEDAATKKVPVNPGAADLMQYTLAIADAGHTSTFHFADTTLPESVRPLIDYLQQNSKPSDI